MYGNLPGTLALFAGLGPVHSCTIKPIPMSLKSEKIPSPPPLLRTASDGKLRRVSLQGYLQMGPKEEIKSLNGPFISMMMID